jgi:hypothetical protein
MQGIQDSANALAGLTRSTYMGMADLSGIVVQTEAAKSPLHP